MNKEEVPTSCPSLGPLCSVLRLLVAHRLLDSLASKFDFSITQFTSTVQVEDKTCTFLPYIT
ncbi:unnamed protein product [Eruca vesicaria subsp. sativa]|uniref:Uncharacterized protein n=1 Tax=Eruca vesicaria subsp. sativa TaxID=29727 RepID=A0ABC8KP29_ERUVS|nr:unnamed protein product [Eruca vesicaria subsp. sativa]